MPCNEEKDSVGAAARTLFSLSLSISTFFSLDDRSMGDAGMEDLARDEEAMLLVSTATA